MSFPLWVPKPTAAHWKCFTCGKHHTSNVSARLRKEAEEITQAWIYGVPEITSQVGRNWWELMLWEQQRYREEGIYLQAFHDSGVEGGQGWECASNRRGCGQWLASKHLLDSRVLWQVKYGDLDKKSSMFWQQPVPLFGYNMKNWVIKDWSYTVQLCAHFWLHLELQKLQWLLRKESLAFLLICCNIPGREPMCQFKYPLKVQGTVIFPSHHASLSPSGMCAKSFHWENASH